MIKHSPQNPKKRVAMVISAMMVVYLVGLLLLPPAIMLTSTNSAAPLVTMYNAIFAPFVLALQKVPILGSAWTAYVGFLCEATQSSCS